MALSSTISGAVASVATLAVVGGTIAYGVNDAQSQLFGETLVAPSQPDHMALTFDDGPNPAATPRLIDSLARHGVRATFFLIGDYVVREPALARRIAAAGHVIGNHTMTHPFLPGRSMARIRSELVGCNHALEDALGQPVTLFRPPHGGRSPAVFRAAAELGLAIVQWNLMVADWKAVPAATILRKIERGLVRNRRRGTCVVLHDGGQASLGQPRLPTVEAVELLLSRLPIATKFVVPPYWT